MSGSGAPDSWEQEAEEGGSCGDLSAKFSTLNVNAAEFVPSFSYSPPTEETEPSEPPPPDSPVTNGKYSSPDRLAILHLYILDQTLPQPFFT
jgi:peptide chain release factor subunit 3